MGQSKLRAAAARPWSLLLVCLAGAASAGVMQARAQPDSSGFISIDCGFPGTTGYVDNNTTLPYAPDAAFTDTGENYNISAAYVTPLVGWILHNLRSFPDGARNCYTLPSLSAGLKYLLRTSFMYGNYDGLNSPPVFDLYVGINFWKTVNVSSANALMVLEAIVVAPDDFVQVCLVNTGSGTPFISGLDLRPLKSTLYPQVNETQGQILLARRNFGPTGTDNRDDVVRYPDDPYDRIWISMFDDTVWDVISTTMEVTDLQKEYEAPSMVMQTAITPRNASNNIHFFWDWDYEQGSKDPLPEFVTVMYFSELVSLQGNAVRQFYINLNGELWYPEGFTPRYLYEDIIYSDDPFGDYTRYDVSINATANSTLPPIINAIEVFSVVTTNTGTNSQDVSAMMAIKEKYRVQKNWMGDPCLERTFKWDGLTCSYPISGSPGITGVNMSFSGLNGDISSTFAKLKAVQFVDLSHNNLTGSIPDAFSQLPLLTVLDLTGNQLSGSIPPGLQRKIQDGSLNLIYADNPNLCTASDSCQTAKGKGKLAIYVAVPIALVLALAVVIALLLLRLKRRGSVNNPAKPRNEMLTGHVPKGDEHEDSSLRLENRRFTYKDLGMITNNFQRVIGQGGFGYVYEGFLEDGTQVAVKLRSQSSNQGDKEFLTEAQILTRVHHKNLVSMIGYCKDGEYMALVYEYMSEGTLQEHIAGKHLTWRQRLRIALESAQGLEYLHVGCNPPLIHRDVKTTNILLNEKLEAKVADFGLSRAFNRDISTHLSTNTLVGTPGYVDPEYTATMQPTTKSDVYSFGVVLLELITGKLPILHNPQPTTVIQWTRQHLARGDIEGVLDARMRGNHDVNSVWKATEIALRCTAQASVQRPTMTDVVAQLQECLGLEEGRTGGDVSESFYSGGSGDPSFSDNAHVADQSVDVSQTSTAFEMEHNFGLAAMMGPATR
ncbi:unnamed protein product [Urochloa humidicola]